VDMGELKLQYDDIRVALANFNFIALFILLSFLILLGIFSPFASSCQINEVMVNPIESDSSHEWIELYNHKNTSINLSGWKLMDNHATDELVPATSTTPLIIPPESFVLITDQDTTLPIPSGENNSIVHFMVDDNSICNGLSNTADYIQIVNANNTVIDSIEWGNDFSEILGKPINAPAIGNSLIPTHPNQSNNTQTSYTETTHPTPGTTNIFSQTGSITIDVCQEYIPKITSFDTYSVPFAIHVSITNFTPQKQYQLKTSITANSSASYPASQTWTGEKWQYSDRYTHILHTDDNGSWQEWIYLRFSKNYKAYTQHIQHTSSCTIQVKIKDNLSITQTKTNLKLLDMDSSTSNATTGGFFIEPVEQNNIVCLQNETGHLMSCYVSEPNNIADYYPVINGYCKLTSPIGSNYTLSLINETSSSSTLKTNITIHKGIYHFDTSTTCTDFERETRNRFSTPMIINNTGSLPDTYKLFISNQSAGFQAQLNTNKISLQPQETQQVSIFINPLSYRLFDLSSGSITVTICSTNDSILQKIHTFSCSIKEPDLTIPKIKNYTSDGTETNSCYQGQLLRIKAFLKNKADKIAHDVTVSYFLNSIQPENLLGSKTYDTVKQYQKYPSLYIDTKQIKPGKHTIFVVADYHNTIKELDEYNNENSIQITIKNTTPSEESKQLLITELYYYAHPTIHNEFITIFNPTDTTISLDNWYITTTISRRCDEQKKILFPQNTMIHANSSITITQNSSAYFQERLMKSDFEYETNANNTIPQLNTTHTIYLSNRGGAICLKNAYNHTIDCIIYGNTTIHSASWNGSPVPLLNQGEIVQRSMKHGSYQDTNTAIDWNHTHTIGQSTFTPPLYTINASVTPFISPDTSFSVISSFFNNASSEILLNAYEFTSIHLTDILVNALQRNVTVNLLVEGSPIGGMSEQQYFLLNRLHHHGATIQLLKGNTIDHIFKRYRFTHAKYAIIDQKTVIIHSGNFAPTGIPSCPHYGNREWGVVITNTTLARFYSTVFTTDWNPYHPDTFLYLPNPIFNTYDYFLPKQNYYGLYQPIVNQSEPCTDTITVQPVLSPDNSLDSIKDMLSKATTSIYIQQLYIYHNWSDKQNPLIPLLTSKAKQGVDIRIILNYNQYYDSTNDHNNQTKTFLTHQGIKVKYIYSNWSIFQNVHNKGVIIDNTSVLISSINWNENSFLNNREIGVILNHPLIAKYYSTIFFSDWQLSNPRSNNSLSSLHQGKQTIELNANTIYIGVLFTMTFVVVARDWRKRSWP